MHRDPAHDPCPGQDHCGCGYGRSFWDDAYWRGMHLDLPHGRQYFHCDGEALPSPDPCAV